MRFTISDIYYVFYARKFIWLPPGNLGSSLDAGNYVR